jgi:hypothetical protein
MGTYDISVPRGGVDEIVVTVLDEAEVLSISSYSALRYEADLIKDTVNIAPSFSDIPLYTSCQHHIRIAILQIS